MSFSYLTRWLSPTFRKQLTALKGLKALPKKHYSWTLPDFALAQPDERVYEVVRIMGSACLQGEYATKEQIETCVKLCHKVNESYAGISNDASIGINLKPYHNTITGNGASPLSAWPNEIAVLRKALLSVRGWLHDANGFQNASVKVGAILLDSEQFYRSEDDPHWNTEIANRYNEVYNLCKSVFPFAWIIPYEWGVEAAPSKTGWQFAPWYVPEAKADCLSCDLYTPCELHRARETFTKTAEEATKQEIQTVVPYLSLASGYQRSQTEFQTWNMDWKYGREYAYQLGQEINVPWFSWPEQVPRFAPWSRANAVVFYPLPLDPRTPEWLSYFISYVRGSMETGSI